MSTLCDPMDCSPPGYIHTAAAAAAAAAAAKSLQLIMLIHNDFVKEGWWFFQATWVWYKGVGELDQSRIAK